MEQSEIETIKAEIAAIKARYMLEIAPLVAKLGKLEAEALSREGLLDIDADEEAMREHIDFMM